MDQRLGTLALAENFGSVPGTVQFFTNSLSFFALSIKTQETDAGVKTC